MRLPQLTVRSVRTYAVEVPMRRPLGTSAAQMRLAPFVLVELETAEGVTGRSHAFCYMSAAAPMVRRIISLAGEGIAGMTVEPGAIARILGARFRLLGVHGVVAMGLSALDVACWDALATAAGMPLAKFLNARRTAMPVYNSNGLSLKEPESLGDEATALLAPGFKAVKIRLGRADADRDIAAIDQVCAALPEGTALMADYNQALTVDEAIQRGPALEERGLTWIEEPIAADDLLGCARVAAALSTPVQLGENFYGAHAVEAALAQRCTDYLMLDLMRIGGVSGWLAAAKVAAGFGVPVSSHLYPEVSVHLLAASESAHWLEYVDWAEPFLEGAWQLRDGMMPVPEDPGTGVRWDAEAVRRYAID
jgi:mandelate racemase